MLDVCLIFVYNLAVNDVLDLHGHFSCTFNAIGTWVIEEITLIHLYIILLSSFILHFNEKYKELYFCSNVSSLARNVNCSFS